MARIAADQALHPVPAHPVGLVDMHDAHLQLQTPLVRCAGRRHAGQLCGNDCGQLCVGFVHATRRQPDSADERRQWRKLECEIEITRND